MYFILSTSESTGTSIIGISDFSSSQNSSTDFMTSKSGGGSTEHVGSSWGFDSSVGLMLSSSSRRKIAPTMNKKTRIV